MKTRDVKPAPPSELMRVGWRIRRKHHRGLRAAAALEGMTCEQFIDGLIARELKRKGLSTQ